MNTLARLFAAVYSLVHDGPKPSKALADDIGVRHGYLLRAADPNQDDLQLQPTRTKRPPHSSASVRIRCGTSHLSRCTARTTSCVNRIDAQTASSLKEFGEYLSSIANAQDAQSANGSALSLDEFLHIRQQALESVGAILAHVEGLRLGAGISQDLSIAERYSGPVQ